MNTVGIDHLAIPTANADRLIEFYKRLGFDINDEAAVSYTHLTLPTNSRV